MKQNRDRMIGSVPEIETQPMPIEFYKKHNINQKLNEAKD